MVYNEKTKIIRKIQAYKYSMKTNNDEFGHCERIIKELESENHHKVVKMLLNGEYKEAEEYVRSNY